MAADESKTGEIWVNKFDEESAKDFRESVISISKYDPNRPILIYIDSYGGMVDSLAKMIETLDEVHNPIITICMGKAMSCGAVLLSHGDLRFCGQHSRVMIHEISSGTSGDVHDMHADTQEVKRLNEYFMGLLARNCGYKGYSELRKLIKDQDGRERYLDAESAVKFGVVDAVGLPKLSSMALYEVSLASEKTESLRQVRANKASKKSSSKNKKG